MTEKQTVLLAGILGLFASIMVGGGEFLLHYSPNIIGNAENYQFFKFVSKENLILGHFIVVIGTPFYFVGYYHIYKMIQKGSEKLATIVFCLGILAFTVGGFWITSRAFLGTIVLLSDQITPSVYQEILNNYSLISESLVQGLRVVILLLSLFFVLAILKSKTYYSKWMAIFNPITLLISVFLVYFIAPVIGKYIAPIAMNAAHFVLFSVSLYQFRTNYE